MWLSAATERGVTSVSGCVEVWRGEGCEDVERGGM